MQRYKLTVEYYGQDFVGWQRQANGLSIQEVLEVALKKFSGETVTTYVAGRTDSGVHATGQVCHIDLEEKIESEVVRDALNYHIGKHLVSVLKVEVVDTDFHARFSAKERVYLYKIVNRRVPVAIWNGLCWHVPRELDVESMKEASECLVGSHDFSTFRASGCQAQSAVKTLNDVSVYRDGENVLLTVRARSFLYRQVRNMVGTLKLVGEGKWSIDDFENALKATDRNKGGPTAPPDGLYLTEVVY